MTKDEYARRSHTSRSEGSDGKEKRGLSRNRAERMKRCTRASHNPILMESALWSRQRDEGYDGDGACIWLRCAMSAEECVGARRDFPLQARNEPLDGRRWSTGEADGRADDKTTYCWPGVRCGLLSDGGRRKVRCPSSRLSSCGIVWKVGKCGFRERGIGRRVVIVDASWFKD